MGCVLGQPDIGVIEELCNLQVTSVSDRKWVWPTSASNLYSSPGTRSTVTPTSEDFISSLTDGSQRKHSFLQQLRFKERLAVSPVVLMAYSSSWGSVIHTFDRYMSSGKHRVEADPGKKTYLQNLTQGILSFESGSFTTLPGYTIFFVSPA